MALTVGVWILLFKDQASDLATVIGFLLVTVSTTEAAKLFLRLAGRDDEGDSHGRS